MLKKIKLSSRYFLFLVLIFLSQFTHAEKAESTFYNPISTKRESNNNEFIDKSGPVYAVTLPDIEVNITPSDKGPRQTGITYQLPEPVSNIQLAWKEVTEGYVTRIQLFADQAKHLRFHLRFANRLSSMDIQLRVQGNLDTAPLGPVNQSGIYTSELWLPTTKGDSAELEIFIKSSSYPDSPIFVLDAINFIVVDNTDSSIIPYSQGLAREKEYDLACWSGNSEYNALKKAADATAKIHYITSDGSYICSGTLLNDTSNSFTLWFATAHHCLPDQATASTAELEWFYQATNCDSPQTDSRHEKTSGGAQLLWTDFENDVSFLKLYKKTSGPMQFSGWQTDIEVGDLIWGVHHPKGDHTMVSNGNVAALLQNHKSDEGTRILDEVKFANGGAEGGSSGSGLFSIEGDNSYWKGTLYGGPPGDYQKNSYSHFDRYFSKISGWLKNTAPTPPTTEQISCVFDEYWKSYRYEHAYNANYQEYIYRFNQAYDFYLGVSYTNNHLYYMYGYDGRINDLGPFSDWLKKYGCDSTSNTLTWKIKDLRKNNHYQVNYKFYDIDNDLVWPSNHEIYYIENYNEEYSHVLPCNKGAKICIGGRSGGSYYTGVYWGVDIDNSNGCTDCCSYCDGSTRYFNFVD
ncbi:MAG: trypsin-like peptidase domain-containing protein [Nitrosomonas sp.]|nr:MAG: trypsin-like peptidase domain-containing protein [Nitrosomonas sp.]